MKEIGHIKKLQIQQKSLKKGQKPDRYYDPTPLLTVPALRVTTAGVIGLVDGREELDVHHANHELSKNRASNAISFNFTSHYEQIWHRFGSNLPLGGGGENLLIETGETFELSALQAGLVIETAGGHHGRLVAVKVAAPCVPFSEFVLQHDARPPAEMTKTTLQFLDNGRRGFYCSWQGDELVIQPGDRVFLEAG